MMADEQPVEPEDPILVPSDGLSDGEQDSMGLWLTTRRWSL